MSSDVPEKFRHLRKGTRVTWYGGHGVIVGEPSWLHDSWWVDIQFDGYDTPFPRTAGSVDFPAGLEIILGLVE